jgi:hypothetical protein
MRPRNFDEEPKILYVRYWMNDDRLERGKREKGDLIDRGGRGSTYVLNLIFLCVCVCPDKWSRPIFGLSTSYAEYRPSEISSRTRGTSEV